jgi:hypothetical protein
VSLGEFPARVLLRDITILSIAMNLSAWLISHGAVFFLSQQISFSRLISRRNHRPNNLIPIDIHFEHELLDF